MNPDNAPLLEEYFQKYLKDPYSLDSSWKSFFSQREAIREAPRIIGCEALRIEKLIGAYRCYGYLKAEIDPLETKQKECAELQLGNLGFSEEELDSPFPTCGLWPSEPVLPLRTIVSRLESIYAKRLGIEYAPFCSHEISGWIQKRFEQLLGTIPLHIDQKREVFRLLSQAELFETFLHTRFVGQKRFSLEGAETLIPMLYLLLDRAVALGAEDVVLGMPHRGRLNVLANIFQKPLSAIIGEFHGKGADAGTKASDVKYHKGFSTQLGVVNKVLNVKMCSNPSHLESVNAIVMGDARARQKRKGANQNAVIPILIHGDAAISGQGVVYESLQLSHLKGYDVGGTIHIVINNQIGFTALPEDSRSTPFCTDIAKTFGFPVFHVNAEDVESAVYAALCAIELRDTLHTDVFIDLNCYRKYGHNESDEPAYTQPLQYELIRKKKSIRELFFQTLLQEGDIDRPQIEAEYKKALQVAYEEVKETDVVKSVKGSQDEPARALPKVDEQKLIELATKLSSIPSEINIHSKLRKTFVERLGSLDKEKGEYQVDFAFAEALAFGTILQENISCRLAGQDSRRGTFSQRHAALADQKTGTFYYPLKELAKGQKDTFFEVYDSSLSEYAALAFEYGYSVADEKCLVLWEAQFGDFANGAQVIIDQYIAPGESKWGTKSGLTLLLPHGYEGQGPEHSSARMERYLALAAEEDITIVNPTTPAQYYHLLRRQAHLYKPLIIFTPKGLLRYGPCASTIKELATDPFQEVIDDVGEKETVRCLAFCQGRIYYDLLAKKEASKNNEVALIRIEQLYPLNVEKLKSIIKSYRNADTYLWVQEEPMNAGAWSFMHETAFTPKPLQYIGRKRTASPAVGSHEIHEKEQKEIIDSVFCKRSK